jgi:hypothetical protein
MLLESDLRSFGRAQSHGELLAQGEVFGQQFKAGSKETAEKAIKRREDGHTRRK